MSPSCTPLTFGEPANSIGYTHQTRARTKTLSMKITTGRVMNYGITGQWKFMEIEEQDFFKPRYPTFCQDSVRHT